jgi:hypothetical protein
MEPGETREVQMKLHNDGNSPLLVLLTATISESSWAAEVIGPAGSPLIEIGAFDEASFTLRVTAPADANSGTSIPVAVSAEPYGTNRSFEDEHIANLDVSVSIEITSISMRLMNEIQHPRLTTGLFGVGALLLFVAAIQNRINRRRWALHQEQQELLIPEEESLDELFSEKVRDEPSPADEAEDSMSMQDDFEDDIELIDFDDD